MLDKRRIRVFAAYVKENGPDALLDRLQANEKAGVKYHYPGQMVGDYDAPETEEGIVDLIENGKRDGRR